MRHITDLLHILLCIKDHETDMMKIISRHPDICYYYLENDIAEGDLMPDHQLWQAKTDDFKSTLSLGSDEEALNFIRSCIQISHSIQNLSSNNKFRLSFIKSILNLT